MNLKILTELDRILKHNPALKTDKHAFCQVINGIFDINLKDIDYNSNGHGSIPDLGEQIDRACLRHYFSKIWQPETKKFKYSGLAIIDEVNKMNPDNVIDVGCKCSLAMASRFFVRNHLLCWLCRFNHEASLC